MKKNLKQNYAKIGLKQENVIMERNVNLLMENMNWLKKQFQIRIDINQNLVIAFLQKDIAHMDKDVYFFMKIEKLIKYQVKQCIKN